MSWLRKRRNTTDHRYVEERLSAYLDDELSPQEQGAVSQHLAACQACQWQFDTLQQTAQWTRELPTIPVPRVFTISAPARPAPAPRQRRGWAPLLQGATALIALLFVVVVAGDIMLSGVLPTGSAPALAPQSEAVMEMAVADVAPTQEVGKVEKEIVLESEAAVKEGVAEPERTTASQVAAPTQEAAGEPAEAPLAMEAGVAPTLPPEAGRMTAMGGGSPDVQEKSVEQTAAPLALMDEEAVEEAEPAEKMAEPTPSLVPTILPPEQPSAAAFTTAVPTVVADARERRSVVVDDREIRTMGLLRQPVVIWLRLAECALGTVFIILGTITVVVALQRRRGR